MPHAAAPLQDRPRHRPAGRGAPGAVAALRCAPAGVLPELHGGARHQPAAGRVRRPVDRPPVHRRAAARMRIRTFASVAPAARLGARAHPPRRRRSCSTCPSASAPGTPGVSSTAAAPAATTSRSASSWRARTTCPTPTRSTRRSRALVAALLASLPDRSSREHIVGHSDIAPGRKTDPGPRPSTGRACAHALAARLSARSSRLLRRGRAATAPRCRARAARARAPARTAGPTGGSGTCVHLRADRSPPRRASTRAARRAARWCARGGRRPPRDRRRAG